MFFSGYRPLFVVDHFRQKAGLIEFIESRNNQEYMPWDVSVSGLPLNPEMKNVPRYVVRNLVPYKDTPTEEEALKLDKARREKADKNVAVLTLEVDAETGKAKLSSIPDDCDLPTFFKGQFSQNPELLKSMDRFFKSETIPDIETPFIVESPASESYGRVIYATSVKRKRKLKMNKHKLRKRRKLQRALKRKLKR